MTRNTNSSMRKMVMTGLMLTGLVLGGLGTVGCDRPSAEQIAQLAASSGVQSVKLADSKFVARSAIGPMYRRGA